MESLLVVGAGLAGLGAVRAARELGFAGTVTVVGAEVHRPYDRPPLSKDYLSGASSADDISLEGASETLDADWRLGTAAVALDAATRTVTLADGSTLTADAVVLATGSRARTLAELESAANAVTLRTLDDADHLRGALQPGARVVIVGAGLIGSEVASTAAGFGCQVTIVSNDAHPLARLYGDEVADHLAQWHRDHDVEVVRNAKIDDVERTRPDGGSVTALLLGDGRRLATDVVVVAVGGEPDIGWLLGSGLEIGDGVLCSDHGATSAPGVVAVGDCAAWFDPHLQRHQRAQHWNDALERPAFALAALLGAEPTRKRPFLPYFWSDQYGHKIQMAGYGSLADAVSITDGDPAADTATGFVAEYTRAGEPVAVLTVSRPRDFMRWRRSLTASLGQLPAVPTSPSLVAEPAVAAPAPLDPTAPNLDPSPEQETV